MVGIDTAGVVVTGRGVNEFVFSLSFLGACFLGDIDNTDEEKLTQGLCLKIMKTDHYYAILKKVS